MVGNTGQSRGLHGNGGSVGEQAGKVRRSRLRGRGNAEPGAVKLDIGRGVKWGAAGGFWRGGCRMNYEEDAKQEGGQPLPCELVDVVRRWPIPAGSRRGWNRGLVREKQEAGLQKGLSGGRAHSVGRPYDGRRQRERRQKTE